MADTTATTFNARTVITDAFLDLGIFGPADQIPPEDAQFALRTLNRFIGSLATQKLSFPYTKREVFSVVAGTSTYTIGPTGTFATVRPQRITGAGLLYPSASATTGRIEIDIDVMTDEEYKHLAVKDMQSAQFTAMHYDATYAAGLGSVFLWPTPNTTVNSLVLYRGDAIQGFADLTTTYDFPPGYAEALQYNLEKRLCRSYGKAREWGALDEDLATNALRLIKRQNFQLRDTPIDMTLGGRGHYDITIGD